MSRKKSLLCLILLFFTLSPFISCKNNIKEENLNPVKFSFSLSQDIGFYGFDSKDVFNVTIPLDEVFISSSHSCSSMNNDLLKYSNKIDNNFVDNEYNIVCTEEKEKTLFNVLEFSNEHFYNKNYICYLTSFHIESEDKVRTLVSTMLYDESSLVSSKYCYFPDVEAEVVKGMFHINVLDGRDDNFRTIYQEMVYIGIQPYAIETTVKIIFELERSTDFYLEPQNNYQHSFELTDSIKSHTINNYIDLATYIEKNNYIMLGISGDNQEDIDLVSTVLSIIYYKRPHQFNIATMIMKDSLPIIYFIRQSNYRSIILPNPLNEYIFRQLESLFQEILTFDDEDYLRPEKFITFIPSEIYFEINHHQDYIIELPQPILLQDKNLNNDNYLEYEDLSYSNPFIDSSLSSDLLSFQMDENNNLVVSSLSTSMNIKNEFDRVHILQFVNDKLKQIEILFEINIVETSNDDEMIQNTTFSLANYYNNKIKKT